MKKILSLALLLSGMSFATFAQETPKKDTHTIHKRNELIDKTAEEIAKKRTDHIDKEVKLTDKQRKAVYELYLDEAKAHIDAEVQASNGASNVTKKDNSEKVHKLLTAEQQKVLADKRSKNESQKSGKRKAGKMKAKSTDSTKK